MHLVISHPNRLWQQRQAVHGQRHSVSLLVDYIYTHSGDQQRQIII
jgi:hypothetical protein